MVNVIDEQVEGLNSLFQSGFDVRPLDRGNNPGHDVERKYFFVALLIAVDGECNTHAHQCALYSLLPSLQVVVGQGVNSVDQNLYFALWLALLVKELIVERFSFIVEERQTISHFEPLCSDVCFREWLIVVPVPSRAHPPLQRSMVTCRQLSSAAALSENANAVPFAGQVRRLTNRSARLIALFRS